MLNLSTTDLTDFITERLTDMDTLVQYALKLYLNWCIFFLSHCHLY